MLEVFMRQMFHKQTHQKGGIENFLERIFSLKKFKICKFAIGGMLPLNFIHRMYKVTLHAVQ